MSPAKKTTSKNTSASKAVAKKAAAVVKKGVAKVTGGGSTKKKSSAAKTVVAKKTVAKKTVAKKTVAKKPMPRKTTAKKTTAKKPTPQKKTSAKSTGRTGVANKATAKKGTGPKPTTAKKTTAKKTTAKKTTAKKTTTKTAAAKKSTAGRATPSERRDVQKPPAKTTRSRAPKPAAGTKGIGGSPAKETATTPGAPLASDPAKTPLRMPKQNIQAVPQRKQPPPVKAKRRVKPANLDKAALASIKKQLQADMAEYEQQLKDLDTESFTSNQSDVSGERAGMGEDFADAGTATFDRERDLSIRNNVLDLMDQVTRALQRIEDGNYGTCESCGNPIDADRIKAFPRSLMCIDCKRREERIR